MTNRSCLLLLFALLLVWGTETQAQTTPKREMRAVWISTVTNIDWPSQGAATQVQKDNLTWYLDQLLSMGFNTVIFQVRPECDALYDSPYDPWSKWLTGAQGLAPNPYYDPLKFAVEEAHKRGMELHAWFNPYRCEYSAGSYTRDPKHVTMQHPEWVVAVSGKSTRILNPGIPAVRDYVSKVVADVVRRYDIDGAHFDDYFYLQGITTEDQDTYAADPRGLSKNDWRRDNVNRLVKQVNDSIKAIKPWVKWGISPPGGWKWGEPAYVYDAYTAIYCDAVAWLSGQYIDYLTPQIYWDFGGSTDYATIQVWWASKLNGRHYYPGLATYNVSSSGIAKQIRMNRGNAQGSVQFTAHNLTDNRQAIADTLKNDLYKYKALVPAMTFLSNVTPNAPSNFRWAPLPVTGIYAMQWDAPAPVKATDTAMRYVLYQIAGSTIQSGELDNPPNLQQVVYGNAFLPAVGKGTPATKYYALTSYDRFGNESGPANVLAIEPTTMPTLAAPADNAVNFAQGNVLSWRRSAGAGVYNIEVSTVPDFAAGTVVASANVLDTVFTVNSLNGQQKYYWHVNGANPAGITAYTAARSFTTGWPANVPLISPATATINHPLTPTFTWAKGTGTSFQLQISRSSIFDNTYIAVDTMITSGDTSVTIATPLAYSTIYRWRVRAMNGYGTGNWSTVFAFKTMPATAVEETPQLPDSYALSQNYPNPFNPTTAIAVSLPQAGTTTLKVYDLLGREVAELMNGYYAAGTYRLQFNGSRLSSGMYFYTLTSGDVRLTKRMILLK